MERVYDGNVMNDVVMGSSGQRGNGYNGGMMHNGSGVRLLLLVGIVGFAVVVLLGGHVTTLQRFAVVIATWGL